MGIVIDINKAKAIGHELRRAVRAEEFKPLDEALMKQIPGTDIAAIEAERQVIRDKYAAVQAAINAAQTTDAIKSALE